MKRTAPSQTIPKLALSIKEAALSTSKSERSIAEAIRLGRLRAKADGLRVLIPVSALEAYIAALPDLTGPLRESPNRRTKS